MLCFCSTPAAASSATLTTTRTAPWNAETSDLEPDSSIIYGQLPNGLRYAIRRNERPQNQVVVRMAVDFGSAVEAEDERGLAHFIEHMAFNGTTNVPEGEMVRMLERLGLRFGADTNASTGFTQTQYKLDLPKADPALIERALFLMRETASEMLFSPQAVDRERGVIIAEKRERENYSFQSSRAANALYYPDTYFSTRYPIGEQSVLESAPADRMKALYRKWYRPDRTRIIIVGPVDVDAVEREIAATFSDWRTEGAPLGPIDRCTFDSDRVSTAASFTHPNIGEAVGVQQILADRRRPDTVDRAMLELKMQIASAILSQRLSRRSREDDLPFLGGGTSFSLNLCDAYARVGFGAVGKDGSWQQLLPFVEQAVRQATQFGFSEAEVAEQLKRLDSAYDNAARSEATKSSGAIADDLVGIDDDVLNSAQYRQLLWRQLRPFMTKAAIDAEFARWFGQLDEPLMFLTSKSADGVTPERILAQLQTSRAVAVAPQPAREQKAFAYTDFGPAGAVVDDRTIADLGIRTLRFANGVMLNLKKTDFEDNRVRFSIRIDGGELHFGREMAPLARLMSGTYVSGGLAAHDIEDLRSILAGTTVSANFGVADDYFGSGGSVAPADLDRQLEVMAAFVKYPGWSDNALRLFRRPLPETYARLDATPNSALGVAAPKIMTESDPRFTLAPLETMQSIDFAMLQKALGDALLTNRMEIALVGDIDEQAAIAAVARTFGALPQRRGESAIADEARRTGWAASTGNFDIPHRGEPDQLAWRRVWTTTDDADQKQAQGMDLLARIVTVRLIDELREKLGATYGGGASSSMSEVYPGRGSFAIATSGDPKDLAAIEGVVDAIIAEVTTAQVDADLFDRARKPVLESYADWRRQNGTWIGIAAEAQTNPERLERFRRSEALFKSISPDYVWQLAKKWLGKNAEFTFRALPAEKIAASTTAPKAAP